MNSLQIRKVINLYKILINNYFSLIDHIFNFYKQSSCLIKFMIHFEEQ